MKIYVKSNMQSQLHLRDVLKQIIYIELCKNVNMFPRSISATEDIDNEAFNMMDNEKTLMRLSDENLMKLSDLDIAMITDGELLHRLNRICPERLLKDQLDILKRWYSDYTFLTDESDVKFFLSQLQTCNTIICRRKDRNGDYVLDSGGKLKISECLEVLKSLTYEDNYIESMHGADDDWFGDDLLVFHKVSDWTTRDGIMHTDMEIYIKLDLDMSTGDCVSIVSFHEPDHPFNQ